MCGNTLTAGVRAWLSTPETLNAACVLQVASTLLPLCFVYDIFWVFIQPLLTDSTSVMVEVSPWAVNPEPHAALEQRLPQPCSLLSKF